LPNFVRRILEAYSTSGVIMNQFEALEDHIAKKRGQESVRLVDNLAKLFSDMLLGNRKYSDPT
jgi:hypothetical protein